MSDRQILKVVRENLGAAFTTALRKAADSEQSDAAWKAIMDMSQNEWRTILDYTLDSLGVPK